MGAFETVFTTTDWVIVITYLVASVAAGLIGKRFIGSVEQFLMAGRELSLYVGIATLAATEIGTITYMYNSELGYKHGFASFAAALTSGVVMIVVGRTGFVISRLRQLKLMTVPQFFEIRYSRGLRLLTGVLVALGGILNMGVFLRIEGEFLTIVSGIPARYLVVTMTLILLLELTYTVIGGMVSVVITDFIQYVLLSIATLLVSVYTVLASASSHCRDRIRWSASLTRRGRELLSRYCWLPSKRACDRNLHGPERGQQPPRTPRVPEQYPLPGGSRGLSRQHRKRSTLRDARRRWRSWDFRGQ